MGRWMGGCVDRWMNGWACRGMDEWVGGRVDGWNFYGFRAGNWNRTDVIVM